MDPTLATALIAQIPFVATLAGLWVRSLIKRSEKKADEPTLLDRLIATLEKHADFGDKVIQRFDHVDKRFDDQERKLDQLIDERDRKPIESARTRRTA